MSVRYHSVGPYAVHSRLGSGGMADVLKAVDERDGRTVALKIPKSDPGVREAERVGALLQKQLSEVDPHVPAVYEIHDDPGDEMYIVMEYVAGEDLSDRIRRGPLDPRDAVRIAIELCEVLCAAQRLTRTDDGRARQGIVHGDLKPRNVRLADDGTVRVLDFGIAKALSLTRALTRNEFGSLPYSSPERIESGHVDVHSDLWAVSVVLYEMLTGNQPFRGESTRRLEDFIRSRARPDHLPEGCPESLAAVLRKALAPTLERRYAGPAALRDDLAAFLAGRPTLAEGEGHASAAYEETRRSTVPGNGHPDHDDTRRTLGRPSNGAAAGEKGQDVATAGNGSHEPSATYRSLGAAAAVLPAPVADTGAAPRVAAAGTRPSVVHRLIASLRRIHVHWRVLALLTAGILLINEARVSSATGEFRSALPNLSKSDPEVVWTRYRQLRSRSFLRFGTFGLNDDVKDWYVAGADELIADYRSDAPVIRENGWRKAQTLLGHAASIAPGDHSVRARVLYCRGHLARIDAQAARNRRPADARRLFNTATGAFEEAARLRPRWADPHLGLARTYVYGLEDPEQARESLRRAEEAGYQFGNRDMALLGDGYRLRAERTWTRAADFRDLPQEDKYLDSIREDCQQALHHYETIPAYGDVSRSIRRVEDLLARVDDREDERREASLRRVGLGFIAPLFR